MKQFHDLCEFVLKNGKKKSDRTGTGTISYFGYQMRFNLKDGFPLLTTKKTHWASVAHELIWFIKGETNIKYLVDNKVRIWNEWPYEKFKKSSDYKNETIEEFAEKVRLDSEFAKKHGNLGPVYGKQWRNFGGVDQLKNLINEIKQNPKSRRLIISAWNPVEIKDMLLPPCHAFFQFYINDDNELSCQLYQRSADIFLGVPFNIASYSLLVHMVAHVCGLKVGDFVHTLGDAHIYLDHVEKIHEMLSRKEYPLPTIRITKQTNNIEDITFDDIQLDNYQAHPVISGKVSV